LLQYAKRQVVLKGREKTFIMWHRHAAGKGKVSISVPHLWGTRMSFGKTGAGEREGYA
jgi:hypothetical protein